MIFLKYCSLFFVFQFFFVSLQPNSCSTMVERFSSLSAGSDKRKTVPSVEQAGANPARHIVAKAKEGLPSYAESNESVY